MTLQSWRSFVQGVRETAVELGDPVPDGMEEGDVAPADEDRGELDRHEYLRGQVRAIIGHLRTLAVLRAAKG